VSPDNSPVGLRLSDSLNISDAIFKKVYGHFGDVAGRRLSDAKTNLILIGGVRAPIKVGGPQLLK
jgi:hypothetical protein